MGKILIIKGSDFSVNKIRPEDLESTKSISDSLEASKYSFTFDDSLDYTSDNIGFTSANGAKPINKRFFIKQFTIITNSRLEQKNIDTAFIKLDNYNNLVSYRLSKSYPRTDSGNEKITLDLNEIQEPNEVFLVKGTGYLKDTSLGTWKDLNPYFLAPSEESFYSYIGRQFRTYKLGEPLAYNLYEL